MHNSLFLLIIGLLFSIEVDAQLFKRISNRVQDKLEKKIEEKVVEEVSEEIARRAMRPINNAFDKMFREAYKEEYGKEYDDSEYEGDPEKQAEVLGALLTNMYGTVDLPESYDFSYSIDIETKAYNQKSGSNSMTMFIAPSSGYFGMSQADNQESFIILDVRNDQAVIFNKKEKSVMAIKGALRMASSFASSSDKFEDYMRVNQTGLKKNIAGYNCEGYGYDTEDDTGEFYLSTDLPFDWNHAFASIYEEMFSDFYENESDYSGMLMYSESVTKKDGKKSTWEVTKLNTISESVDVSEYQVMNAFAGK